MSELGSFLAPLTAGLLHILGGLDHLPTVVADSAWDPFIQPFQYLFGWLYDLLKGLLTEFYTWLEPTFGSQAWGVAIIMLTIVVRLVLFPLTFKQYQSALRMQALQPKIKELQKKYKNDRALLQQETMKLYQTYRVNPFASCLPVLLQLPVFICLYYAIRDTEALKTAPFLWIPALGEPDPYYILFVLYIVTQMISTELTMTPQTDPQQKWIMRAMPIFFVFILFNFPSGLFVYWVTTNLWTIGQQLIIRRTMHVELKPVAEGEVPKKRRFMDALVTAQQQREVKTGKKGAAPPGQKPGTDGTRKAGKQPGGGGGKPSQGKPAGRPSGTPAAKQGGPSASQGGKPSPSGRQEPPGKAARREKGKTTGQGPKS
ncbi:MAG TPA: YidC/Oxa1 family membrane protein insertase [Thermoleophilia bacterium]|nr:YidC/Oxa1 family membrane protein insertase [Thermoleophilia bacterium]